MTNVLLTWLSSPTTEQRDFGIRVRKCLEEVVNNAAFLKEVRGAKYSSASLLRHLRRREVDGNRIAEIISTGLEARQDVGDGTLDVRIRVTDLVPGLLGDVLEGTRDIDVDVQYLAQCIRDDDVPSMVQLWMHEWLHVAGFRHVQGGGTRDAAYVVDEIAKRFAKRYAASQASTQAPAASTRSHAHSKRRLGTHKIDRKWRCQVAQRA